jgi:hypothetical protein
MYIYAVSALSMGHSGFRCRSFGVDAADRDAEEMQKNGENEAQFLRRICDTCNFPSLLILSPVILMR